MRKLLFLFIGLMFTTNGFSQGYHPIPTDSAYWVETESYLSPPQSGGADCWATTYKYVYSTGLTVLINGNQFNEFRYNAYTTFIPTWPMHPCDPPYSSPNQFYAFIRNDSANKKVYIYDTTFTHQEYVIYDFNINLGDTIVPPSFIHGNSTSCPSDAFVVSRIDSIDLGGSFRKRFGVTRTYLMGDTTDIIEGVGNELGFMFAQFCPFEDGSTLVCFHQGNLEYVPESQVGSPFCTPTLSIENDSPDIFSILKKVGPNQFEIINPENNNINVTCYDMAGKLILQKSFHESDIMDFSTYSPGVYIMMVSLERSMVNPYKFIIQH
jgi:hypothetical protein